MRDPLESTGLRHGYGLQFCIAAAGVLDKRKATSFPGVLENLSLTTTQITQNPIEQDGNVITSRGPGTAMDFALHLIQLLSGPDNRNQVEAALQRP